MAWIKNMKWIGSLIVLIGILTAFLGFFKI